MDQRAVERQTARFTAHCVSLGQSSGCRLLNISPHGCLIDLAEPILAEGNPVRIRISGVSSLDGKIIWAEGSRAGVAFASDLHQAVVEYIAGRLVAEVADRLFPPVASAG